MTFWFLILFAYLLGSIPFGLLIGRFFAHVDVRQSGSGNIGATNVNRLLGRKLGAATLLCDMGKGVIAVFLAILLLRSDESVGRAWVGFAAFIGHCFPVYLGFKGGKGVATMFGVMFLISFFSALIGGAVWLLVVKTTRVSALGALSASVAIPVSTYILERNSEVSAIVCLMMVILIYRHRENIRRLKSGAEKASA